MLSSLEGILFLLCWKKVVSLQRQTPEARKGNGCRDIKSLDMQQEEVVERIKAFAQRVLPEGSSLWLYGSRARGDAHPDSDYDLLLLLNTERITDEDYEHYVYDLFLEGLDWGAEINTHAYPRHRWESWTFSPFYKNVERDKIVLK